MRTSILAILTALCIATAQAQNPAQTASPPSSQVHCSFQPGPAPSPALTAFTAGDFPTAETLYAAQTSAAPAAAYPGLVRAQLQADELPAALASAKAAIAAQPKSALAQSLLGDVLYRAGQVPESFDAYKQALTLDTCSARTHLGLARLYALTGRHEAAAHEFDLARRLSPADPDILAAYLESLPRENRAAPLRAFLAGHPALPPQQVETLTTDAAILTAHALCTPVSEQPTEQLALVPIYLSGRQVRTWGLDSKINGTGMPLLELDSSVHGIVLNPADAEKADVIPLPGLPAPTATEPYTGTVAKILLGGVEYSNCPVRVVPASYLANLNSLIGTDFFRDHLIHLDYASEHLTLSPLPPRTPGLAPTDLFVAPEQKAWSPIYTAGADILVPTLINKKGPFLLVLDTGIGRTIFSPAVLSASLSGLKDGTISLEGTSGPIVKVVPKEGGVEVNRPNVYTTGGRLLTVKTPIKLPVLRFTTNEVPQEYTASFDITPLSHKMGVEASGLMGFLLLRTFITDINYRDALARIQFDTNRRYLARVETGQY